jgi:hypothetical protein
MCDVESIKNVVVNYLAILKSKAYGHSVEVRIPPYGAIQCIEGPVHRRGTPRAVIEMDSTTFISLATGEINWADGVLSGSIIASGERADLTSYLPLL